MCFLYTQLGLATLQVLDSPCGQGLLSWAADPHSSSLGPQIFSHILQAPSSSAVPVSSFGSVSSPELGPWVTSLCTRRLISAHYSEVSSWQALTGQPQLQTAPNSNRWWHMICTSVCASAWHLVGLQCTGCLSAHTEHQHPLPSPPL